jgi:hypothetical protein
MFGRGWKDSFMFFGDLFLWGVLGTKYHLFFFAGGFSSLLLSGYSFMSFHCWNTSRIVRDSIISYLL